MHVTLAAQHRQPRLHRPERCDNCVGLEIMNEPVPVSTEPSADVRLYNILIGGGVGSDSFHLHAQCADSLRKEA
jgi:hypothetical protein